MPKQIVMPNNKNAIENLKKERKDLFLKSSDHFNDFDKERRDFIMRIATLSATVGAFSFLIFDKVASPNLLKLGDFFLGVNIIYCVVVYLLLFKKDLYNYHSAYFDIFERMNKEIEIWSKIDLGLATADDLVCFHKQEISNIGKYERPVKDSLADQEFVIILFALAWIFILLSFVNIKITIGL